LAYSLSLNKSIEDAIEFANIIAGLTVTKLGAQSSLPDKSDLNKYIGENQSILIY